MIDLRGDHEREDDPPRRAAGRGRARSVHGGERGRVGGDRRGDRGRGGGRARRGDLDPRRLPDLPRALPATTSPRRSGRSRDAPEGGVVIHCVGGKDRTGLLAAFLLHLAGVADDEIAADYALSEERLLPRHEALVRGRGRRGGARAPASGSRRRRPPRWQASSPSSSGAIGTVEGYLRDVGVTDDELELIRARLRG